MTRRASSWAASYSARDRQAVNLTAGQREDWRSTLVETKGESSRLLQDILDREAGTNRHVLVVAPLIGQPEHPTAALSIPTPIRPGRHHGIHSGTWHLSPRRSRSAGLAPMNGHVLLWIQLTGSTWMTPNACARIPTAWTIINGAGEELWRPLRIRRGPADRHFSILNPGAVTA